LLAAAAAFLLLVRCSIVCFGCSSSIVCSGALLQQLVQHCVCWCNSAGAALVAAAAAVYAGALLLMCCCALQRWTNRLEAAFETHHCMPAGMSVFFFPVIITRVFVEGGSSRQKTASTAMGFGCGSTVD
jgi:hypothetical protein